MRATFLIDNISSCSLASEWGLAVFIEYHGHKILLDTGAGPLFTENAAALGADYSVFADLGDLVEVTTTAE